MAEVALREISQGPAVIALNSVNTPASQASHSLDVSPLIALPQLIIYKGKGLELPAARAGRNACDGGRVDATANS